MYYLTVEGLTKYYGEVKMFDSIGFTVNQGDKTAIVAKNGTGKTTLVNILLKKDVPSEGKIQFNKDISVGILEQDPVLNPENTIFNEVYQASEHIMSAIEGYNKAIETHNENEIQQAIEKMDLYNAWDYDAKVKQVLQILNIAELDKKVKLLSGGQKKRIALAKVIIFEPDFLILDEPTNHLDIEMIEWLEGYLKNTSMTLLMITHDRYFLDNVCNSIIEIDQKLVYSYNGNYSYFLQKRQERLEVMNAEISKAKNLYKTELDWIRKQPRARGTKAKYRVDAFVDLSVKANQKISDKNVIISVESQRLGNKIIEFSGLTKSFGSKIILNNFNYRFNRLEKVGIIGPNGCGKTTFLNILAGILPYDSGEIEYGETLKIGYYKQDGLSFLPGKKVIDIITDIAQHVKLGKDKTISASQFLEMFLFPPATQHNLVSKLSGGERKRLYLMTILIEQPNFLILDEPTNDLDIQTLQILEDYLQTFEGCVILVSHDRFFTDKLVEHLFVFDGDGVIKDFPGNYSNFKDWKSQIEKDEEISKKALRNENQKVVESKLSAPKKKISYNDQKLLQELDRDISLLTLEKKEIEEVLSSGKLNNEDLIVKSKRIADIINILEEKEMKWLELQELFE